MLPELVYADKLDNIYISDTRKSICYIITLAP